MSGSSGVAAGPPAAPASDVTLTSVSPDAGPIRGGTLVRLTGPGLRRARSVTFGAAAGTRLRINDDGSLTVRTPPSSRPAAVTVVVRLADGRQVTRRAGFSYLAAPTLDSAAPTAGSAGTWVTLDGSALARTTIVYFGAVAARHLEIESDNRVRALAPAHSSGPVDITVSTPGGTSNAVTFVYVP